MAVSFAMFTSTATLSQLERSPECAPSCLSNGLLVHLPFMYHCNWCCAMWFSHQYLSEKMQQNGETIAQLMARPDTL